MTDASANLRLAGAGLLINLALAMTKLAAGILGHSYALIADAIESLTDVLGSAIVWGGLRYAARPPDEEHPYGHGKAEALAAFLVGLLVLAAGIGIGVAAVREIVTPHHAPAPFTLLVLVAVVFVKETLFRIARARARRTGSTAILADAAHHRADAITSIAAFVGISIALIGGPGYEPADDWAALLASSVILYNAWSLLLPPVRELLDTHPTEVGQRAAEIAASHPGVNRVQKIRARKSGTGYWLDMHVWVDPGMTVRDAHTLAHRIKDAIRAAMPRVTDVLIHIEPGDAHSGAVQG